MLAGIQLKPNFCEMGSSLVVLQPKLNFETQINFFMFAGDATEPNSDWILLLSEVDIGRRR